MPRYVPRMCRHKHSGQAYVTDPATGKEVYLGRHGSAEADDAYGAWLRAFLGRPSARVAPGGPHTVDQLLDAYLDFAETYYVKRGKPTSEVGIVRMLARRLAPLGRAPVDSVGPADWKGVRAGMVAEGLARDTVNTLQRRLCRVWRWGVEHGMARPETLAALKAVTPLAAGRSAAREPEPVGPPAPGAVAAALPHMPPAARAVCEFMLASGARPAEACGLHASEVNCGREPWEYRVSPEWNKTEHKGRPRVVFLGPRSREALEPWLVRAFAHKREWVFPAPKGGPYRVRTLQKAIRRACRLAGVPHWHPNQLRHEAGTRFRAALGVEAAMLLLGHADAQTSAIYAERSLEAARAAAERLS